jgi:phytoene synthase
VTSGGLTTFAQPPGDTPLREAYAFCRAIAHQHGANFSVGFRFLPKIKRDAVYAAYAYCRWVDDVADEPGEQIPERLDECQRELERCYAGHPTAAITVALRDTLDHFPIPQSAFVALIDGCRQDLVKSRYETFDELLGYCDLVATSISDISLAIYGYKTEAAKTHGRNLATALQLTNVTRDIGDDLERDRIYVPAEELRRFGVSEAALFARERSESVRELILFQAERAQSYFHKAEPLLEELTFDSRFPTLLMGSIYSEVLKKIMREPFAPLGRRLRLSTPRKVGVVLHRLLHRHFV